VSESTPEETVLAVRWPEFDRLTTLRGWTTDAERARQIGISDRMLNHMRKGRAYPGPKVIDCFVRAFGHQMYDVVFERTIRKAAA
jgi:hypothetical protein